MDSATRSAVGRRAPDTASFAGAQARTAKGQHRSRHQLTSRLRGIHPQGVRSPAYMALLILDARLPGLTSPRAGSWLQPSWKPRRSKSLNPTSPRRRTAPHGYGTYPHHPRAMSRTLRGASDRRQFRTQARAVAQRRAVRRGTRRRHVLRRGRGSYACCCTGSHWRPSHRRPSGTGTGGSTKRCTPRC